MIMEHILCIIYLGDIYIKCPNTASNRYLIILQQWTKHKTLLETSADKPCLLAYIDRLNDELLASSPSHLFARYILLYIFVKAMYKPSLKSFSAKSFCASNPLVGCNLNHSLPKATSLRLLSSHIT